MSDIIVRPYQEGDYSDAIRVAFQLINPLIDPFTKLGLEKNIQFMKDIDGFPTKELEGVFVATEDDQVVGVMNLRFSEQPKYKSRSKSLFRLFRTYGIKATLMGIGALSATSPKITKKDMFVDYICVDENHRSKGIGKRLLERGEAFAREHNKTFYALSVLSSNPRAKELYERFGYEVYKTEKMPKFIAKRIDTEYEYKMRKPLS